MSTQRRWFVVALYSLLALLLLSWSVYSLLAYSNDGAAILGGVVGALIAVGWLARIAVNIAVLMRD